MWLCPTCLTGAQVSPLPLALVLNRTLACTIGIRCCVQASPVSELYLERRRSQFRNSDRFSRLTIPGGGAGRSHPAACISSSTLACGRACSWTRRPAARRSFTAGCPVPVRSSVPGARGGSPPGRRSGSTPPRCTGCVLCVLFLQKQVETHIFHFFL